MSRLDYHYCPYCGEPLERREAHGSIRPVCPKCGFTHFRDPKVAVIGLAVAAEHVLLIRRGVDPERGKWALPGGFMDAGERPEGALERELAEEVGLTVSVGRLLGIFPMAALARSFGGIVIAYHVIPSGGGLPALQVRDDATDAGWFLPDKVPACLAFDSTHTLLRMWRDGAL